MRTNEKSESKMGKSSFGVQMRDRSDEKSNVEFADEFGVTGSEISKVKKQVNRD